MENNTAFVIDNDIPVPPKRGGGFTGQYKYPFGCMEIGQSFFVPQKHRIRPAIGLTGYNRRLAPKKFVQRIVDGGVRVWRVE